MSLSKKAKAKPKNGTVHRDPRVFLGFAQPPLASAAEYICSRYRVDNMLDLSEMMIVLPTSRSAERLLQLLVLETRRQNVQFAPAHMLTIGEFPEQLYPVEKPLATELCQQIAWAMALQESGPEEIACLFPNTTKSTIRQWQPYAKLISQLHKRLGNDVWSFSSVVREVLAHDKNFREIDRWSALQSLQQRYYQILNDADLWDTQAARNVAVRRKLCRTDKQVLMIGMADINRATKMMLEQIREQVTILVAATRNLSERFDEFGGIITEQWLHSEIQFPCDQLRIVDTSDDQGFAVAHFLQELGTSYSADQITVGVADPDVQPQIERSLKAIGVAHRDTRGQLVKNTAPVKLSTAMLEFLAQQNFTTFAALVRHPDMYRWVCEQVHAENWLNALDEYQINGLPDRIAIGSKNPFGDPQRIAKRYRDLPHIAARFTGKAELLNQVFAELSNLFSVVSGEPRPIADWTTPWCEILEKIYGSRVLDQNDFEDQKTLVACREIYRALHEKQKIPSQWDIESTAHEALEMAIDAAADWPVASPPVEDSVELTGWLDLPLDDVPVMVVTGMNDENVPTSENGHLFLPNRLCTALGILDNDRRYARDAYAMTVIKSVHERVLFIAGRRDLQGEPKKPSRLLFADENEVMARRANAFFAFDGKADSRFWLGDPKLAPEQQQLPIPRPVIDQGLAELSVTSFKEFIKCPYRFYLSKILRLEAVKDDWQEMDARAFGNLAHEVLEDFGNSDKKGATVADDIYQYLCDRLDARAEDLYGGHRLPAVKIQIEQLRMRLHSFAQLQAEQSQRGWRILGTEQFVVHKMIVNGKEFRVKGTVDRIDVQENTGRIAVWDYKTSDQGDEPTKTHLGREGWKDLQLPLYRKLITEIDFLADYDLDDVQLGYVQLPKALDRVGFSTLRCTGEQLADADRLVERIISDIQAGRFWPPKPQPPLFSEAFAGICQDNVFERHQDTTEVPA